MTISKQIEVKVAEQNFVLLPEKAIFWEQQGALLLADVHAGKATHFRNNGIPLSTDLLLHDLNKIEKLLKQTSAKKLIILGDLFHSIGNTENSLVEHWVENLHVPTELILGNHDTYSLHVSRIVTKMPYEINSVFLSHEPVQNDFFNIHGHLHPGIHISGKARNHVTLPAFYVNKSFITLPAFGNTTGKKMYAELCKSSQVIAITNEGLLAL